MGFNGSDLAKDLALFETAMAEPHLDVINKAMKALGVTSYAYQVKSEIPTFTAVLGVDDRSIMKRCIVGMQRLGYKVVNPNFAHLSFTVRGDGPFH